MRHMGLCLGCWCLSALFVSSARSSTKAQEQSSSFFCPAPSVPSMRASSMSWKMNSKRRRGSGSGMWAQGPGQPWTSPSKGAVDLVLVHAKSLEEKFVQEGFGTERIDLMYNDFVIVGPPERPGRNQGDETGDGGPQDHLAERGSLHQPRRQIRNPCGGDGVMAEGRDQTVRALVCHL